LIFVPYSIGAPPNPPDAEMSGHCIRDLQADHNGALWTREDRIMGGSWNVTPN